MSAGSRSAVGRRGLVLTAALLALTGSCISGGETTADRGVSPSGTATRTEVTMPEPFGPLAGLTWPAGSVPENVLLHDDGRRLWAVPMEGHPELLWEHPPAGVYQIEAGPGGRQLAYSVMLPAKRAKDPSYVLYLLDDDGSVKIVDVVHDWLSIESPIFLRPPTELDGPVRLYWIRGSQEVSPQMGRLENQVMVLGDQGPMPVQVPLRYEEVPFDIHGYPGSWMFTLALFRTSDVPTRLEILLDLDFGQAATDASLTLWGDLGGAVNTDIFTGVAWVSPLEWVVPVAHEFFPEDFSLRLFRFGCDYLGSHVVHQGTGIDWGYPETPWPLLPAGPDRVLVLRTADVRKVASGKTDTAPWWTVDVYTGRMTRTDALWSPPGRYLGWWTFVQPESDVPPPTTSPDCSDLTWTYP